MSKKNCKITTDIVKKSWDEKRIDFTVNLTLDIGACQS